MKDKIKRNAEDTRGSMKRIIDTTRREVIKLMEEYFEEKEQRMLLEIENEQKKQGVQSASRMDTLLSYI
jgi:hypothetical protein